MMLRRLQSCFLLLLLVGPATTLADDTATPLQKEYRDTIRLIRGMYQDDSLHFDHDGVLLKGGHAGSWTTSFMYIKSLDVNPGGVQINGVRIAQIGGKDGFHPTRTTERIHIKIDGPNMDEDSMRQSLVKVFVAPNEPLAPLLPDYWRDVLDHITGPNATDAVPKPDAKKVECTGDASVDKPCRVGGVVKPPKPISTPDPKYTEVARQAKYQGTTVLWVVVDQTGATQRVKIARAQGFGLDDEAVRTVREWKFKPATRDGNPIAVQINVEVNFRLY
jgi:TonB family protein